MSNNNSLNARMTIDLKRYRFRIHKTTLHGLGNPKFVQILINPENLYMMILGLDKPIAGGTSKKITAALSAKSNMEFYNSALLDEILKIFGTLNLRFSYHLSGEIDQINRVAYFYFNTLKKIEGGQRDDGQRV